MSCIFISCKFRKGFLCFIGATKNTRTSDRGFDFDTRTGMHHFQDCVRVIYLIQTAVSFIPASPLVVYFIRLRQVARNMLHTTCHYKDYDWSPSLQQPCCCRPSRKSSYCATFALLPPTVRPCTVLLQYTLPLHSLTVRPCHCIQYTLPPTCSTVVTPPMLLTALYCPATVHAAFIYFGLVLSTVHAAY